MSRCARRCLDTTIRIGRCGDWVYYVSPGDHQRRRLWVKPRDPRTPNQLLWRARLGAASRRYSESLTDEQQDACIAAGAKRPCRPRLGPSGVMTGQRYLGSAGVRKKGKRKNAECSNPPGRPANTGDFATHMGTTPGYRQYASGATPAAHAVAKEGQRQKEDRRAEKSKGGGGFESAATPRDYPATILIFPATPRVLSALSCR